MDFGREVAYFGGGLARGVTFLSTGGLSFFQQFARFFQVFGVLVLEFVVGLLQHVHVAFGVGDFAAGREQDLARDDAVGVVFETGEIEQHAAAGGAVFAAGSAGSAGSIGSAGSAGFVFGLADQDRHDRAGGTHPVIGLGLQIDFLQLGQQLPELGQLMAVG